MKPIFSIHAGEYLVGNELEKKFPNCEVWVPSKDTGTDLLISNSGDRSRNAGIQVKFSKDFLPEMKAIFHKNLTACGWWTLNTEKIEKSNADLWFLTPYSFMDKKISFIIIEPDKLLKKLVFLHGRPKTINTYFWITKDGKCFETRGLKKKDQKKIIELQYDQIDVNRDFSHFLNNWEAVVNIAR
jgi:hypothetical protein